MPTSTALKSSVTRRQAADSVDQAERLLQAEHHEAVENAVTTEQEAPTATLEPAPVPKAKHDSHALQSTFLAGNLGKPITVFLVNGIRLVGKLRQYDQFTLLGVEQAVVSSAAIWEKCPCLTRSAAGILLRKSVGKQVFTDILHISCRNPVSASPCGGYGKPYRQ